MNWWGRRGIRGESAGVWVLSSVGGNNAGRNRPDAQECTGDSGDDELNVIVARVVVGVEIGRAAGLK